MNIYLKVTVILVAHCALYPGTSLAVSDFLIGEYDAGPAGGGPASIDPVLQGWSAAEVNFGTLVPEEQNVFFLKPDGATGFNALQINDQHGNTPTDNPRYFRSLSSAALRAMHDFGWEYEFRVRPLAAATYTAWGVGPDSDPGWGFTDRERVGFTTSRVDADNSAVIAPVSGTSVNLGPNSANTYHVVRAVGAAQSQSFDIYVDDVYRSSLTISATTSNSAADDAFFVESGSSSGTGRIGNWNMLRLTVPAPDTLSLQVNTTTGQVKLINHSSTPVSFNSYFIESAEAQLRTAPWNSLESTGLDGNGIPDDGIGWEEFDSSNSSFLGEGFLTGATTLAPSAELNLGAIYNPAIAGVGVDGDLAFTITDELGRIVRSEIFGTIDYVTGAGIPGDFDTDGDVDNADYELWKQTFGSTTNLAADGNGNGVVDAADYTVWRDHLGVGGGALMGEAVPEPGFPVLLATGVVAALLVRRWNAFGSPKSASGRRTGNTVNHPMHVGHAVPETSTRWPLLASGLLAEVCANVLRSWRGPKMNLSTFSQRALLPVALALALTLAGTAFATQVDRDYTFGDDPWEASSPDAAVGAQTYDSAGTLGSGDLQDLNVSGGPVYRSVGGVSGRPGAEAGDLGIEFDGVDDVLFTPINMDRPSDMWDSTLFFPGPPPRIFPHNYEGINSNGIQLWAKPTDNDSQQALVFDSQEEHGVYITQSNTWAMFHSSVVVDSGVSVASTLDSHGWVHVMKLSGFATPVSGTSSARGALLINGVAVAAQADTYEMSTTALSIGARVTLDSNGVLQASTDHYHGLLDDLQLFFWGDNSDQLGDDGVPGGSNTGVDSLNADGQNWQPLNLAVDNVWIAQKLASLNVTDPADVDLSGGAVTLADVDAFLMHWRQQRLVDGVQVGDWVSRQNADLNYDGIVNLADAYILHNGLQVAGLGGLNFALLYAQVPEPSTVLLFLTAAIAIWGRRRRQR